MNHSKEKFSPRNRPHGKRGFHRASTKRTLSRAIRCLLSGTTLLGPASMVTAISCGLNCNAVCEHSSGPFPCMALPASSCVDGGEYPCVVITGCHCGPVTDPKVGCNIAACASAKTTTDCALIIGCEWGDACRDLIDCHSLESESACKANDKQCYWSRDCG